jgi:uncharacterized membrane protein (UPF0136 family)
MTDAMLRATGIVVLLGIAVIHFVQIVPTYQQSSLLGLSFLALIAGSVLMAAHVVRGAPTRALLWVPVGIFGILAMAGYAFTRMVSSPLDRADVGNWSCMLGLVALFVEVALVALSAYAMKVRPLTRPAPLKVTDRSFAPYRVEADRADWS